MDSEEVNYVLKGCFLATYLASWTLHAVWVAVCTDHCDTSVFMVQVVGECIILEFRKGHMQVLIKILHEHKYLYSTFVQHDSKQKAIMRLSISKLIWWTESYFQICGHWWPLLKHFPV